MTSVGQGTQNEGTLVLAKALQHCMEWLGQDLQRCMEPLMCLEGDDMLEASLLEATDNEPGASPTPKEEVTLLGEDSAPQET